MSEANEPMSLAGDVVNKRRTWDENYQELKVFLQEHGHLRPKGASRLRHWAGEQRKMRLDGETSVNIDEEQQRRIRLLDEINFDWETDSEKKEQRWQYMFGLLKDYKKEFLHMAPKQKETYRGEALGNWVTMQQSSYRDEMIKEHRKRQLEQIGFLWVRDESRLWKGTTRPLGKLDDDWNERFAVLCEFKEEHGHTLVPIHHTTKLESGEDCALGTFVNRQRGLYRNGLLRKERQEKLESINFVFEIDIYDTDASTNQKEWDDKFLQLVKYKNLHGHCDIPVKDEDNRLGEWARQQRALYTRGGLAEPRFQRLDDLGFSWAPLEKQWKEMVGHLRAYKALHRDCLVPDSYKTPKESANLGNWVRTVRGTRRGTRGNMELSLERIAELDELGFEWENVLLKHWDTMYDALVRYKQKHGDCRVPHSYKKDPQDEADLPTGLAAWVSKQRQSLEKKLESTGDSMYIERRKRLEDIGFEFSLAHVPQENWETMFGALKAYKEKHGDCRVPYSFDGESHLPRSLGGWVYDQRATVPPKAAAGNQISIDRQRKLNDIGFDWDGNAAHEKWMQMFDRLKEYHAEHGNCRVPGTYDKNCDGLPAKLGNWVGVQKNNILSRADEGDPVYMERKRLLDTLNFEYDHVHQARWEEIFDKLKQYYLAHGDCQVPKDYDGGNGKSISLFNWARNQRKVWDKAEKGEAKYIERKKLLDSIQYDWELVEEGKWMAMFDVLKAFKDEHGHCDVPYGYGVGNADHNSLRALGPWCHEQRQNIPSKLNCPKPIYDYAERKRLLDSIGFEWKVLSDKEKKWNDYFQRLESFKAKHGHCRVPPDKESSRESLYIWVKNQQKKTLQKAESGNPLYVERKARLDAIEFEWHGIFCDTWEKMRVALEEYKKKHGHTRVPYRGKGSEGGPTGSLGIWVYSQRVKLPPKVKGGDQVAIARKQKLDKMGFEWIDVHSGKWETMFAGLERFYKKYGHCKVKRDYKDESDPLPANLGSWLSSQRQQIPEKVGAGDEVAIERKERLDALGFVWHTRAPPKAYQRNGRTIQGKQRLPEQKKLPKKRSPSEADQPPQHDRGHKRKATDASSSVELVSDEIGNPVKRHSPVV